MFSGITSFLFGSSAVSDEPKEEEPRLTTVLDDNEWLLVDVATGVPLPIEQCPLVDHLNDSIHETMLPLSRIHDSPIERHRRVTGTRRKDAYVHAIASGQGAEQASWRFKQQQRGSTRKSFDRSNRASEQYSQCKRQRRFNYKLCYSSKQQRTC